MLEGLCGEVQCIMGNGHVDPPSEQTDTHNLKLYLPATSLGDGKNM